ncbi:MAG: HEAT repeat domain-containing protein [Phycisphaerales bacterium]
MVWALALVLLLCSWPCLLIGLVRLARRFKGARCYCPGQRARWWMRFLPTTWLRITRCGYNLSGHLQQCDSTDDGQVDIRCPECGREISRRNQLKRDQRGWRLIPLGLALCALSLSMLGFLFRDTDPIRTVPTWVLLRLNPMLDHESIVPVLRELHRRWSEEAIGQSDHELLAYTLAEGLRSDAVAWNAYQSRFSLYMLGADATPALEASLHSSDWQQRQLAAHMLRDLCRKHQTPPSDRLIEITIEGLHDDNVEVRNESDGVAFLVNYPAQAREQLQHVVQTSKDPQQRLLAAAVLGFSGDSRSMSVAVPVLVDHLRDNDVGYDGVLALSALYRFGPDVLSHLQPFADHTDAQAQTAIRWLIWKLETDANLRPKSERPPPDPRLSTRGSISATPGYFKVPKFPND